ncbi:MAG: hypothetical protein MUC87_18540 [Bacteroidia bacterium]|jgi:hypothetical protein|nr:hypothetical protein [Bacteroidia bacterium]
MRAPTLFLLAAILLSPAIAAQNNDNETYRFQVSAFAGQSFNAGKSYIPNTYSTPYITQTYFGAKEVQALCKGGSVMAFPTFLRWKRFCITGGIGWLDLSTAISADSMVNESPLPQWPQWPRTVLYNWRGEITERFVQFPLLIRTWFYRRQRLVFHADAGLVFSTLISSTYLPGQPDAYQKKFFGTTFYTGSLNASYRILSNSKFALFITAGATSQLAATPTQFERRPGWLGGLLALRFDAY